MGIGLSRARERFEVTDGEAVELALPGLRGGLIVELAHVAFHRGEATSCDEYGGQRSSEATKNPFGEGMVEHSWRQLKEDSLRKSSACGRPCRQGRSTP